MNLILPKHVADRRVKQLEKEKKKKEEIPEASKLPVPTGWRILVLPHRGKGSGELRILNDDEILGTTDDPESILSPVTH